MQHKLNRKLVLWTLGGLLLAGGGLHLLHEWQAQGNAAELLRQALRAEERADHLQAITYFSHYLAYEPDDADALARYALMLEKLPPTTSVRRQMLQILEQALQCAPNRHDLRKRLVNVASGLKLYGEAVRHLKILAAAFPEQGDVEHQLGWCQEALGEYERSEASLRRAVRKSPGRLESYDLLAELLRSRLNRPDEAAQVMDQMVEANPQSPRALLSRARYHRRTGAAEEAARDVRRATEMAPDDADVLLAAAESALAADNAQQARKHLERGLELHPRDGRFYRALAGLEVRAGRWGEAIARLRSGLKALPNEEGLVPVLADLLIDDGQLDEARVLLKRLTADHRAPGVASYLQARLLLRAGRWAEACTLLEALQGQSLPGWAVQVAICLGQCYEQLGETDASLAAYRRAVDFDPGVPLAHVGLGAALLAAGDLDAALTELRGVADATAPPAAVWPVLARALLVHNLRLPAGERDWDAVERALDRAEKALPDSPQVVLLRAEAAASRGAPGQSRSLLETARARRPREILFRTALADLARRQGKLDLARTTLEQARRDLGDSPELRLGWLRYAAGLPVAEARRTLEALARELRDGPGSAEQIRFRRQLAEALARVGDRAGAERLARRLAIERPRDLQTRVMLLDLALQGGRDDVARELIAEIRRIEGKEGPLWRAGESARLLALARRGDRSTLAAARKQLEEIKKRRKDWARVPLLEAAADELEGNREAAAGHYLRALEFGERDPAVLARAARLLYERRRYADADQALRLLEEQGPLPKDMARLAAEVALANRGGPRALALARQAVNPASRDYRDHLWLARIQAAGGQSGEAEKTLRHAARVAGSIPDVWVALVGHLGRSGQAAAAEEALREAARRLPRDRAELGLARCEEALGRTERAEEHYRRAVAARPTDFVAVRALADFYRRADEPARAEAPLRKLIDPGTRAPEEHVAQARRALAVQLLAAGGGPRALTEALALLDRNKQIRGPSAADDVARVYVLAKSPERRAEAVQMLDALPDPQALRADEQFLLARAYEAAGDDGRADALILGLRAAHPDNPQYLAEQIRAQVRQGLLNDAAQSLARLERIEPNSPRVRSLRRALKDAAERPPQ